MAKLSRKTALVFAQNAGLNQLGVIGSAAAGAPQFSTDPAVIQSLANYLTGFFGIVLGANSPAIEDMNSICYLFAYQLSYIMQQGVPEWDSATTYYAGSIVQDGNGNLFIATTTTTNQALTTSAWRSGGSNVIALNPSANPTVTLTSADVGKTFLVNSLNRACTFNLPSPIANFSFRIKDSGANANNNPITIHRFGTELFEGVQSDYVLMASGGSMLIVCDGTNWYKL